MRRPTKHTLTMVAALFCGGCLGGWNGGDGSGGDPAGSNGFDPGAAALPPQDGTQPAVSGLRRMTTHEYDNAIRDLIGDTSGVAETLLPADVRKPYDNDYTAQDPSQGLIEGLELAAQTLVASLLADKPRRDLLVGCTPSGPSDRACFDQFIKTFGRLALRRPLSDDEVAGFGPIFQVGVTGNDFYAAIGAAVEVFLQHPEFIYRVEVGEEVPDHPGLFQLNQFEIAQRLSFFLWETIPDRWLLDRADAKQLATADQIRDTAQQMLADPRARALVTRFHSLWLGYESLPFAADLSASMQAESAKLLERVVFDDHRPWQDVFRIEETYVDQLLATHYGLPDPGSIPTWVSYAGTERKGLLSHGTFLSNGANFSDTSPTLRGKAVRNRLLCQDIPPPPPGVPADQPPPGAGTQCKADRYAAHAAGGCAGCHSQMDPIGFGLERYDQEGRFRTSEPTNGNACPVDGNGDVVGVGMFNGPGQLGDLLLETGMNRCVVRELYRFTVGRSDLDTVDQHTVDALTDKVGGNTADFNFDDLMLEYVSADAFRFRQE